MAVDRFPSHTSCHIKGIAVSNVEASQANPSFILTLACLDRPGIVHAVSGLLLECGANITEAGQFNDSSTNMFFMRVRFDAPAGTALDHLLKKTEDFARPFAKHWSLHAAAQPLRTLIMVSRIGHCLNDLLFSWRTGHLPIDIRAVVSNHRDFYQMVAAYNVPFHHISVDPASKSQAERRLLDLMQEEKIDLLVLARYMQVLSPSLCEAVEGRAINIHHSFLPGFKGARAYHQAHERGVKLIGATAHYVTTDLDEGPIIEQGVARINHTMSAEQITALGRDAECSVLNRAVRLHAEHRILLNCAKTVIFE
jgi:formyltetrahydrofolate deformylase